MITYLERVHPVRMNPETSVTVARKRCAPFAADLEEVGYRPIAAATVLAEVKAAIGGQCRQTEIRIEASFEAF